MIEWLRWLVPKFKLPTWEDGLLVIAIIIVGYLVQKYLLSRLIQWIGNFFVKGNKPFIGRVIKEFNKALCAAFLTVVTMPAPGPTK